jgi:septum formation protein
MRLILASTSPRRREILALLGLPFEVIAPEFDEQPLSDRAVEHEVRNFALGKARSVARRHPGSIVVGSDTMILINATKIGKPEGVADAKRILRLLSGETHRIFTSVAILDSLSGPGLSIVDEVTVKMRAYSQEEIECYLLCNEWIDKAGGYSIQGKGRALIESIRGDYLAAVGLPLKPIADYLRSRGVEGLTNVDKIYSDRSFLNWKSFD